MAVDITVTRIRDGMAVLTGERELGGPPYYTTVSFHGIPAADQAAHFAYHAQASLGISGTRINILDDGATSRVVSFKVPGGE